MPTIQPIRTEHATGSTKRLLEALKAEGSSTNNMIQTMAHSPSALEGYLQLRRTLASGRLGPKLRDRIALTVAQANNCEYSLARNTALARQHGLTEEEIFASRDVRGGDELTGVVLQFAHNLVTRSGKYSPELMRAAGYTDEEIVETVAWVALNVFANYLNLAAWTDIDFPLAAVKSKAA
jgi:AhpD family alkylhydroperoxidase